MHNIVNIMHNEDTENTPPTEKIVSMFEPYQNPFNVLKRGRPSCVCTFLIIRRIRLIE